MTPEQLGLLKQWVRAAIVQAVTEGQPGDNLIEFINERNASDALDKAFAPKEKTE